jgi:hypothetical protein
MLPYLPQPDGALNTWAANFDVLLTADPPRYGVTAGDAAAVHTVVAAFDVALTAASDPSTRTKTTVQAKSEARAAMLQVVRNMAQFIRNNLGVSGEDKVSLGLNLADPSRARLPVPPTVPLLSILGATPLAQTIRFADSATPTSRSKPFGAIGMELWGLVSPTPPSGPGACQYFGLVTRNPKVVTFTSADVGKSATFYGRWIIRSGETGNWSLPISMTVAG